MKINPQNFLKKQFSKKTCKNILKCIFKKSHFCVLSKTNLQKMKQKLICFDFFYLYLSIFFRYINGKAIKLANRIRSTHDFGYVSLDILNAYTEDSGTYMCKAVNQLGEAVNTCSVEITSGQSLLMDSQHPEGMYLSLFEIIYFM